MAQQRIGLLHGDIKPSNVLVTADGQLSISDTSNAVLLPDNQTSGTTRYEASSLATAQQQ
ncbi:hypothetical protein [Neoaquamicrobium sediminum]|uniref:hypothetical protein n=1 Tax=Neoaquamicrobium sediminum TaxID=1849104 RepID=UPI004035EF78